MADFPSPGILFKDITPLLGDVVAFSSVIDLMVVAFGRGSIDKVCGIEARGFILAGVAVATAGGAGFVPIRKVGKLPGDCESETFTLEYAQATLEVHRDALVPGERVLIVDDVLATGGTACAAAQLVRRLGGVVAGIACLIELESLGGRARLAGHSLLSLIRYP
ncbi:MAG: adenine phosphoribosyltransferase [Actinomycetota bacterium]